MLEAFKIIQRFYVVNIIIARHVVIRRIFQFRKMLNKELSHFAESSKSGTQVSQFLINTYMDREDEDPQLSMVEVRFSSSSLKFSIHDSYVFFGRFRSQAYGTNMFYLHHLYIIFVHCLCNI